jgi:hypothetical protein
MNIKNTPRSKKEPVRSIDSWCGKCKLILAHTIETMIGDQPARVHCNTCKAQHSYRADQPAPRQGRQRTADAAPGPKPSKPRATRYQALLKGKDLLVAKSYSSKDSYVPGDVMQHPSFGFGVATAIKDRTKIEVLFEGGSKLLMQGR